MINPVNAPQPDYTVVWKPQEGPQTALLACPVYEVFYGGARGGGKTEASIGDWLAHSSLYGEDAVGIFVRRKLTQLSEVIARTQKLFRKLGAKYNGQHKTWTMQNGARLKFVYLERDSDAEEYQGHSYTRIYVEEATNFPSAGPINKLRATLRSGAGVPVGMRLTGNPGGPGHNWVKARYITPNPNGYEIIREEMVLEGKVISLDRVFIPSKISDNRLVMENDPTYILRLKQSGSEALVRAWLEGDWDIVDGAFFDEWDPSKHILDSEVRHCIPKKATRFRAFDWGSAKPFSVGWYAVSDGTWKLPEGIVIPKNALVKYREWYGACGPNKGLKMTADMVAMGIIEREKGETVQYGVADPSIFVRDGGPSIAESMVIKKCSWRRADNKRKAGAEQMRQRLVGQDGVPMLYFLEDCVDTIRTIPSLQHSERDPEDVDTEAEDHAYDETRYAVMSRPWLPSAGPASDRLYPRNPSDYTINELIAMQKRSRINASEYN